MRKAAALAAVSLLTGMLLLMLMVAATLGINAGSGEPAQAATTVPCNPADPAPVGGMDPDQTRNVATIIAQGRRDGIPQAGWVIAVDVGIVEASLHNLASEANPESLNYPHDGVAVGDHTSVGVFQQQDNWGTVAQRMDVAESAHLFYTGGTDADGSSEQGLLQVDGWQTEPMWVVAQDVQVSAFPDRYRDAAAAAEADVAAVLGHPVNIPTNCGTEPTPTGPPTPAGKWVIPLPKGSYYIGQAFGACGALWADCHTGQDLPAPTGTPIKAAHAGVVKENGWAGSDSYGWLLVIDNGGGIETYYAHQVVQAIPPVGTHVAAGELVGHVGETGNTTGPHLHLEVRVDGTPIDPVPFFRQHGAPL